ncbi:MAG: GrpB family protein [Bacteroidia bacterium]|nr:GrpB family protein [Bacteroidia bacterium]
MLIINHNSNWKYQFLSIQQVLSLALDGLDTQIEHVGSTAVVGLAAKPIIDIDIIYKKSDFESLCEQLSSIGYRHHGDQGIPEREVFKRSIDVDHLVLDKIQHHLYACHRNSSELKRHLVFRDYLQQHSDARNRYQELKIQIAKQADQDRKRYASIKEEKASQVVLSILELAEKERIR